MPSGPAIGFDGHPIRMGVKNVLMDCMRIGAGNNNHAVFSATVYEFSKQVAVAKPDATMMQRNIGRVVGNNATGAETDRIGMCLCKVIQPELLVIVLDIIFCQRQRDQRMGRSNQPAFP